MTREDYDRIADTIPGTPGVYQFIDAQDRVIYVGKAKSLRHRVASYFNDSRHQQNKTRVMVRNAARLEITLVESEADAYLLESNLIKKFTPRYNVDLKDGKSYTYLCIRKEPFPRVEFTRQLHKDGTQYFGPYTSKWRTGILLDLIRDLFPLRTCNYDLSAKNIADGKFKVCLEYHIGNCHGPCTGQEKASDYQQRIDQIRNILKGQFKPVKTHLNREMQRAAQSLNYELAQQWKEKMIAFEDYQSKSMVSNAQVGTADVFAIDIDQDEALVYYMKIVNGAVINTYALEMKLKVDEEPAELLAKAIPHIRQKLGSEARDLILPMTVELADPALRIAVPVRGDKRRLLELCEKNMAQHKLQRRQREINRAGRTSSAERILTTLARDLQMDQIPMHIECFDNSNLQGTNPVASCVVFRNGKSANRDYRHYNIKTVTGPDDFASMEEVVYRRYRRMLDEGAALPQLIVIDGGKGQLSSAVKSLEALGLVDQVTIVGIAKRLEEIFFPDDQVPLYINKKSESLKLLQQLRNEAHRFAISFHRDKRSQKFTSSELLDIKGIGAKTAEKLLVAFKSVKRIMEADEAAIAAIVGKVNARTLKSHFENKLSAQEPHQER